MKDVFSFVLMWLLLAPCMLIVNESETIWPNIVGIVYIGIVFLFAKTKVGKKLVKRLDEFVDKL